MYMSIEFDPYTADILEELTQYINDTEVDDFSYDEVISRAIKIMYEEIQNRENMLNELSYKEDLNDTRAI
jgi:hypothetical protein